MINKIHVIFPLELRVNTNLGVIGGLVRVTLVVDLRFFPQKVGPVVGNLRRPFAAL